MSHILMERSTGMWNCEIFQEEKKEGGTSSRREKFWKSLSPNALLGDVFRRGEKDEEWPEDEAVDEDAYEEGGDEEEEYEEEFEEEFVEEFEDLKNLKKN